MRAILACYLERNLELNLATNIVEALAWNLAMEMVAALTQVVKATQDMAQESKVAPSTNLICFSFTIKTTSVLTIAGTLISPIEHFTALPNPDLCILVLKKLMITGQNSFIQLALVSTKAGFNAIRNSRTELNAINRCSGNIMQMSRKPTFMAGYTSISTSRLSTLATVPTTTRVGE